MSPAHQNQVHQWCLMCVACVLLIVIKNHLSSIQLAEMALFVFFMIPALLRDHSGAAWIYISVKEDTFSHFICQDYCHTKLQHTFPVLSPEALVVVRGLQSGLMSAASLS